VWGQNFLADFYNYARTVSPRMTEFWHGITGRRSTYTGVSHVSIRGGGTPASSIIYSLPPPKRFHL